VHVFKAFEYLIDNILLVNIFQDIGSNNSMKICVHEVKDQIDVPIVFSTNYILQTDDVFMAR